MCPIFLVLYIYYLIILLSSQYYYSRVVREIAFLNLRSIHAAAYFFLITRAPLAEFLKQQSLISLLAHSS